MKTFETLLDESLSLITESVKSDFYDMYLMLAIPVNTDEYLSLLTDRVDRLIEHFRYMLYKAFITRTDAIIGNIGAKSNEVYRRFCNITDINTMISIVDDIYNNGMIYLRALGLDNLPQNKKGQPIKYGDYALRSGSWPEVVNRFKKLCHPSNSVLSNARLLDELFGMAHNSGSLVDYLEDPNRTHWLFDALYTRALAHPNELARYASYDARQVVKSANIGHGQSSLSEYEPVSGDLKLQLFRAKEQRTGQSSRPEYGTLPKWLK